MANLGLTAAAPGKVLLTLSGNDRVTISGNGKLTLAGNGVLMGAVLESVYGLRTLDSAVGLRTLDSAVGQNSEKRIRKMKIEIELTDDQETFVRAYIAAALWSSTDNSDPETGGDPLDQNYSEEDIAPESLQSIVVDCLAFLNAQGCYIKASEERDDYRPYESGANVFAHAGHDFWLTRCGHGCGFWDGDWPECYADLFTKASQAFGNVDIEVGDGGKLHF